RRHRHSPRHVVWCVCPRCPQDWSHLVRSTERTRRYSHGRVVALRSCGRGPGEKNFCWTHPLQSETIRSQNRRFTMISIRSLLWFASPLPFLFALGCNKPEQTSEKASPGGKQITLAMMPKSKGNAYFISCKKGADAAAKELG